MPVTRREFLILTSAVTSAVACGCQQNTANTPDASITPHDVDAGPASSFAADGVSDRFRHQGFFLVRRGGTLTALSATCTHRKCTLDALPDRSFICKCHGSEFDPDGHVLTGPASRDLPAYATEVTPDGRLIVHVGVPAKS
jgi:Rieske Fe-S protein